ncbi:MAG TPA: hypothetical protein VE944_33670 [Nostoc sp.]|uniref:hypothetical protein n=1 Tax=Nostoc sp. TaxID=1180 RepID=UPI002D2AA865|nr:hypothetical protein [Nostoc sp.]HYX19213.1 hypothetical protein [Nostoc sp.]
MSLIIKCAIALSTPNSTALSDRLSLANAVIRVDVVAIPEFLSDGGKLVSH